MSSDIFHKWLIDLERKMAKTNRFVVLIVDDCSTHIIDSADVRNLSHIKLVFLPPDVASLIQPYDMEIIKNVKANYMKKIVCPES